MLPVGIENFEEIRKDGYYYVDKTKLIEQLLYQGGKASLFTRPRRFGKTLNMSMLKCFFEIGTDKKLFNGLYISKNTKLCEMYMGKYPVVSISLKGINATSFENAKQKIVDTINEEAQRLQFLLDSDRLTAYDKKQFEKLLNEDMSESMLESSLRRLTGLLEQHYGEKVIVLIDEYDVPLQKANEQGYYDQMALLIRNMYESVLKTNDSLKFAVMTGCLRIAKESIFTGLNNFTVYSITDIDYDETFGFVDEEVKSMLHFYQQDDHYEIVKSWYDGYRFGNVDVYCPWDVINYCREHRNQPELPPKNYWINTSENEILYHFIDSLGKEKQLTKLELERLVNGEIVQKEIKQNLTYKDLYTSIDNLWSTLFMTGYLTQRGKSGENRYNLAVPNLEIRRIMVDYIIALFKDKASENGETARKLCDAIRQERPYEAEQIFTEYMQNVISVRDTFARKNIRENFYHALFAGLLSYNSEWSVELNRESGDGFSDILIRTNDYSLGIVIELKYSSSGKEEEDCVKALQQIDDKRYTEPLRKEGFHRILKYGVACYVKHCKMLLNVD